MAKRVREAMVAAEADGRVPSYVALCRDDRTPELLPLPSKIAIRSPRSHLWATKSNTLKAYPV